MKKSLSLLLLSLLCLVAQAQPPVVPNNIYFADMHLQVREDARADIQKIVDALTKHPAYFQKKVDLADAYFPFVEQAFKQEGVPTDFKYLVLQESGLVSDAVSTSNAVGFWQFKESSATELGVRVNSQVDERKHIIESSRGAAKYMLRSNIYYKNWFNTLLSYYQGLNGTKALTKTSDIGAKKMEVTSQTNKYLLTFLAHKVAYENAIGKNPNPTITLQPVKAAPGQTLTQIAMAAQADAVEVERYNKWLMASSVPADKEYTVMIPYITGAPRPVYAQNSSVARPAAASSRPSTKRPTGKQDSADRIQSFFSTLKAKLNGTYTPATIVAQPGDTRDMLALQGNISTAKFLRINDMSSLDEVVPGKTYYLQAKRSKAENTEYHVAQRNESLHDISQQYGVKLAKLRSKNRMQPTERLEPGRVVWLQSSRPASIPVEIRPLEEEAAPASKEVLAQKPAAQPGSATTVTSAPKPATTPAKAGAISVEVEDPNAAPYVRKTVTEEEAAAPVTTPAGATLPSKQNATTKPAPPLERKAPDQPLDAAQPQTSVPVADRHVVENGETLYAISRKYQLSMEDLLAWNNLDGSSPLAVGQELTLSGTPVSNNTKPAAAPVKATAPTSSAAPTAGATEHTVVAGETLYSISRKYGVTLQDLQTWNELVTGSIAIGQTLRVAAPAAVEQESTTAAPANSGTGSVNHKVAPGESMYAISRKYGVTIKEIMEWNNKVDFNVTVGENLIIKPKQ